MSRRSFVAGLCAAFGSFGTASPVQATAVSGQLRAVATADAALTQTVLALGVKPVAVCDISFYRRFVIEPALPDSVIELGRRPEPNLELLNEIRPDLFLYSPEFGQVPDMAQRLTALHSIPIYQGGSANLLDAVKVATRSAGAALARDGEAIEYIASVDRTLDAIRTRAHLPAQHDYCLFTFLTSRRVRIYTAESLLGEALYRIGGTNVATAAGNNWGFTDVGTEYLADYRADRFVHVGELTPQATDNPVWQSLPFVRQGRVLSVPTVWMFGGLPSALRFADGIARALEGA